MQNVLFLYQALHFISLFNNNTQKEPIITLKQLEIYIFQNDIRETLITSSLISIPNIKEAYLCLHALIEQFDKMNALNQKMWFLNSYRLGDITLLAKDIQIWNQKLIIRLLLFKKK
jgi:hypothetical protein